MAFERTLSHYSIKDMKRVIIDMMVLLVLKNI